MNNYLNYRLVIAIIIAAIDNCCGLENCNYYCCGLDNCNWHLQLLDNCNWQLLWTGQLQCIAMNCNSRSDPTDRLLLCGNEGWVRWFALLLLQRKKGRLDCSSALRTRNMDPPNPPLPQGGFVHDQTPLTGLLNMLCWNKNRSRSTGHTCYLLG